MYAFYSQSGNMDAVMEEGEYFGEEEYLDLEENGSLIELEVLPSQQTSAGPSTPVQLTSPKQLPSSSATPKELTGPKKGLKVKSVDEFLIEHLSKPKEPVDENFNFLMELGNLLKNLPKTTQMETKIEIQQLVLRKYKNTMGDDNDEN